jgi:hypothetical protein
MNPILLVADVGQVWADTWRIAGTFLILAVIYAWWYFILKSFGTY